MFRGIGKAVPAVGMGLLLKDMYTAGQKRSGGKAVKGQKNLSPAYWSLKAWR